MFNDVIALWWKKIPPTLASFWWSIEKNRPVKRGRSSLEFEKLWKKTTLFILGYIPSCLQQSQCFEAMGGEDAIEMMVILATFWIRIRELQAQTNRHHAFTCHLAQRHHPTPWKSPPTNAWKEVPPIQLHSCVSFYI